MQENMSEFLNEVKKNSADKWGVFYESVGGTMYFIINEQD
jgi:hypothetical protein